MSLALIQGYSSQEEDEDDDQFHYRNSSSSDDDHPSVSLNRSMDYNSVFQAPKPSDRSGLPSALDAFSEISRPPSFLNNSIEEEVVVRDDDYQRGRHGGRRNRKEKKDVPVGAVMEGKAQLVGIHERVRSDIEGGNQPLTSSVSSSTQGVKRVATATNPNAEDAADLLRMCLQCGIPKTYSSARGMVCPVCGDRPLMEKDPKKKGSAIKDKEKNKRMKGQSSHATWKSETEMHLRQQFD